MNRGIYDLWVFLRRVYSIFQIRALTHLKDMTMKDSKALLLDYLSSIRDPERAASLFADNGAFELPFLRSLGIEPRYRGRREITALLHKLLELYPDFAFAADDTGKDVCRVCGARARRYDRAHGPSSVHGIPGGRGW